MYSKFNIDANRLNLISVKRTLRCSLYFTNNVNISVETDS